MIYRFPVLLILMSIFVHRASAYAKCRPLEEFLTSDSVSVSPVCLNGVSDGMVPHKRICTLKCQNSDVVLGWGEHSSFDLRCEGGFYHVRLPSQTTFSPLFDELSSIRCVNDNEFVQGPFLDVPNMKPKIDKPHGWNFNLNFGDPEPHRFDRRSRHVRRHGVLPPHMLPSRKRDILPPRKQGTKKQTKKGADGKWFGMDTWLIVVIAAGGLATILLLVLCCCLRAGAFKKHVHAPPATVVVAGVPVPAPPTQTVINLGQPAPTYPQTGDPAAPTYPQTGEPAAPTFPQTGEPAAPTYQQTHEPTAPVYQTPPRYGQY